MGCGSGGGNTTTTSSGPPAAVTEAYSHVFDQAKNVGNQPLQQYNGPLVAGFTPDQVQAFGTIRNAQGVAQPYINAASNYLQAGAAPVQSLPFTSEAVNTLMSPYLNDVAQATEAQFANQNAQQQEQVKGNAAMQNAYGGDRTAVAQALTAGQQSLAQSPVIANLYNTGYGSALGEFNALNQAQIGAQTSTGWLQQGAGYGLANLGQEAQGQAISGAQQQLQTGALQQQLAQERLNVPYEQFVQQQAYPFQTTNWLSNIAEGIGGASGGTSSTTSPGPSAIGQIAGLGTAAAGFGGLYNSLSGSGGDYGGGGGTPFYGANGLPGYTGGNRGGRFPRTGYADGGLALPFAPDAAGGGVPVPGGVPDVSLSVIPAAGAGQSGAHGALSPFQSSGSSSSGGGGRGLVSGLSSAAGAINAGVSVANGIAGVGALSFLAALNRGGGVGDTAPEPASDIHAQIRALGDPRHPKDAVFVGYNNEAAIPSQLPSGVGVVRRREGILLTTNPHKAAAFSDKQQLTEHDMAGLLGYAQDKNEVAASGGAIGVQAHDHQGNVISEAAASQDRVGDMVRALSGHGAVSLSSLHDIQARRQGFGPGGTPSIGDPFTEPAFAVNGSAGTPFTGAITHAAAPAANLNFAAPSTQPVPTLESLRPIENYNPSYDPQQFPNGVLAVPSDKFASTPLGLAINNGILSRSPPPGSQPQLTQPSGNNNGQTPTQSEMDALAFNQNQFDLAQAINAGAGGGHRGGNAMHFDTGGLVLPTIPNLSIAYIPKVTTAGGGMRNTIPAAPRPTPAEDPSKQADAISKSVTGLAKVFGSDDDSHWMGGSVEEPYRGYDTGGTIAAAGQDMNGGLDPNPVQSAALQRYMQMPLDQLQAFVMHATPDSPQIQTAQRALQMRRMQPQQQTSSGAVAAPAGVSAPSMAETPSGSYARGGRPGYDEGGDVEPIPQADKTQADQVADRLTADRNTDAILSKYDTPSTNQYTPLATVDLGRAIKDPQYRQQIMPDVALPAARRPPPSVSVDRMPILDTSRGEGLGQGVHDFLQGTPQAEAASRGVSVDQVLKDRGVPDDDFRNVETRTPMPLSSAPLPKPRPADLGDIPDDTYRSVETKAPPADLGAPPEQVAVDTQTLLNPTGSSVEPPKSRMPDANTRTLSTPVSTAPTDGPTPTKKSSGFVNGQWYPNIDAWNIAMDRRAESLGPMMKGDQGQIIKGQWFPSSSADASPAPASLGAAPPVTHPSVQLSHVTAPAPPPSLTDAPAAAVPAAVTAPVSPHSNYRDAIIGVESHGDPTIRNPNSTAGGRGQFIDGTWVSVIRNHHPDIAAGKTDAQLIAMKTDRRFSDLQDQAIDDYKADNAAVLQKEGIANPSDAQLSLAHFLGPGGAAAVLKADPNTPLAAIVPKAIGPNPFLKGMTAGQLITSREALMSGQAVASRMGSSRNGIEADLDAPPDTLMNPSIRQVDATPVSSSSGRNDLSNSYGRPERHPGIGASPWLPLIAAGLGMMASRSSHPLSAIGEGGLAGVKVAQDQEVQSNKNDLALVRADAAHNMLGVRQQALEQQGQALLMRSQLSAEKLAQGQVFGAEKLALQRQSQDDRANANALLDEARRGRISAMNDANDARRQSIAQQEKLIPTTQDGIPGNFRITHDMQGNEKREFIPNGTKEAGGISSRDLAADVSKAVQNDYGDPKTALDRVLAGYGMTRDEYFTRIRGTAHPAAPAPTLPPEAVKQLQEGHVTQFGNGQKWKLQNGQPVQVQ